MTHQPCADPTLRAENAELRARLYEAEQTLRAIRAGEVEALVVEGDGGPQLHTLQGLEAEQNRLRGEMLSQVSDAVIAVDIMDRITFLNAAAERQYGVRAGDVLGRKRTEIYTNRWPSPEAKARKEAAQCESGEWRGELIHRTLDGREFPVEVSVTLLRGPDGECTGRVATIRDITIRKEAEAALRRNAALFSEIIEQAPGGVYVVDAQFRVAQMNAESLPFFASAQPLIGRDFDEVLEILWGPEIGPQCASIFRHTLATGERYVSQRFYEQRHDICMEQAFEWETQRITLPDGQRGVVCYFQDVTARERIVAARRESEERLTLAVKASKVALFQQDLQLRYQWIQNPVPGFEAVKVVGKRDADLMERAEDAAVTEAVKRQVIRSGVGVQQEVLVYIQNEARYFDLLVEPVRDAAGLISGVTCAAIDITARKHAEAARKESENHLRFALQAAAAGAWDWNIRSGEIVWSPENFVLYDIDPAQGPPRYEDWQSLLHPEDRNRVNEHVRAVLDGREAEFRTEFRLVNRQGAVRWLLGLGRVERDRDGQAVRLSGLNLDITERRHAEAARRETERNYRALATASSEIAYQMSADWSSMQPLEGRELVASSDRPLADWAWLDQNIPRDEHARVRQAIGDAIARKNLFEMEHRVLNPDGSIGWTFSRAVPILDENQSVVAWFGAASDITARKQAEEERRLLASIVENSRDFIGISDTHGNPVYGNRAAMELVGVKDLEQVRRSKIIDYFIPEQRQFVEEVVLPAVATDGRWSGELTMQHFVTGATFPVWYDLFRVDDRVTGQPVNFATITRDLTESKRVEKALADRTEMLNGVLEGTTDVVFVWDLNGRLRLANAAFAAPRRFTPEQLVGKTIEELFPPDEAAMIRQHNEAVIAAGSPIQLEQTILVAGDARVCLTLKAPLRDGSNGVVGILGISRDITERKRIELSLTHATAIADKANRAKSDFLSSMSHELRTPLNAILGFAQLLESSEPALTPAQMRNLDQILKGGWYLLELINEILDLALVESGKLSLTQEPVSFSEVMRECRAMFEPQAHKRGIDMTFPTFDIPGYVRADRTRVKQVLINLLSNAIKYNKARGAVTVEWTLSPPDSIRISVRDTGEGLASQQLAQLFMPFNRLGKEAGTEEGTGIGLVMAKRLVEMMGGAMGADSVVGVGSVFWFELKRDSAPQTAVHEAKGVAQLAAQTPPRILPRVPRGTPIRKVLYVEDNPANLALIEELIARRSDLRLLSATDGNRGIELTRAHQPHVILVDVNLPGINGIEVMKILRADPSTAHIPIVALSANALPRDIENGIEAGFFNYLTKPIKVTQFMDALDVALYFSQSAPGQAARKEQA